MGFHNYDGFQDLMEDFEKIISQVEEPEKVLEVGTKELVNDLKKLPKPMSQIHKSGYTHLINTFTHRIKKHEVEVGWGKYYGPMLEHGTVNMEAKPHVEPLFEKNKEKYYQKMVQKIFS